MLWYMYGSRAWYEGPAYTYIHVTSSPVVTGSVFMQSMYLLMHARNVNYLDYKLINNKAFKQAMEQILFQVQPFEKW